MISLFLNLAVPLVFLLHRVRADHATCNWQPWTTSPAYHRFYLWCTATFHEAGAGRGQFLCDDSPNTKVADYGILRQGVLEWAKPCGSGGFGYDFFSGTCDSAWWALCPNGACSTDPGCLYMYGDDDCEWPTAFNDSTIPKSLEVWAWI